MIVDLSSDSTFAQPALQPRLPIVYTGNGPDRDEMGNLLQCHGATATENCASCPASKAHRPHKAVPAFGARRGLMIVGEGPSTEEIIQGYPFVGPSGHELNRVFVKYGIDRQLMWISNALICPRPYDDKAMAQAVNACNSRLEAEMRWVEPRAILALGRTAMMALHLETTSVGDARGTVQQTPLLPGVPVITSLHPAAILRGGAGEGSGGDTSKQKMNMDAQMMFLEADIVKAHSIATGAISSVWSDDIEVFVEPASLQMPKFAMPPAMSAVHRKQPDVVVSAPVPVATPVAAPIATPKLLPVPAEAKTLPAPLPEAASGYEVDATCALCGTMIWATPSGAACESGHGDPPFNPVPEGATLRPLPLWDESAEELTQPLQNVDVAAPEEVAEVAETLRTPTFNAFEDAAAEDQLQLLTEECKRNNPDILPALIAFANRIKSRDVFIELMAVAIESVEASNGS